MSSRPCVQILYFASLAFLANCIYNFIFYFFFCGNLFCLKKMMVCVLRVFLAIFLSLLTYFFSCSVSQSLRVSLSSFHFFFNLFPQIPPLFLSASNPKIFICNFCFRNNFVRMFTIFVLFFFWKHVSPFPYKIGDAGTRSTDTLLRFNTAIRSISNLTLRACKLHTPTS